MARKKKDIEVEETKDEEVKVPVTEVEPTDEPVEDAGAENAPAEAEAEPEAEPMKTEVVDFDNDVKIDAGFARGAQALQRALLAKKGQR